MSSDWIEFNDANYDALHGAPRVLLNSKRIFRLNGKALELLGKPAAVRFLFDAARRRIGIRAEDAAKPHAFRVLPAAAGTTSIVRGASFCKRFGIKPEFTLAFQGVQVDGDGTLILELDTARRQAG